MDVLGAMIRSGVSLSRAVELTAQWDRVLALGPLYPVTLDDLHAVQCLGIGDFHRVVVVGIHHRLCDFVHSVVVHRRDEAIGGWRIWLREDPLVHPYKWLRTRFDSPAPVLQCDPLVTPGGSGALADPARIDEEFRKAWLPYFCRSGQKYTSLEEFSFEVGEWLPLLPVFELPRLTGQVLADVVQRKGATAGSLDGWGWRELKVLPVSWFDELARILAKVEDVGVWPDGLLLVFSRLFIVSGLQLGWVSLMSGFGLGYLTLSSVLVVVVGRLRFVMPLLLMLRRFLLALPILMFIFCC